MKQRAYAKINICLDVVERRADGYHDLRMIMLPIDFYDQIELNIAPEMVITSNVHYLPTDRRNTMVKAIEILREEYHFTENFAINLKKCIPTQGGLAGGSSDGAAVIRMVNTLLNLKMSYQKMIEIATKVGADVPFCIRSTPSYVEGIGDILTPFKVRANFFVLLVKPYKGVSTKLAFGNLNFETLEHPDCFKMMKALQRNEYNLVLENLGNSLEQSAFELVPEIKAIKQDLLNLGFDGVLMSGSGSTVFGLTQNEELLDRGAKIMAKKASFVKKTKIKDI